MCQKKAINGENKLSFEAITLAKLISYIEEKRETEDSFIKLSDLINLYKSCLADISQ